MAEQIVKQIKSICRSKGVPEPNLFTEFGSFTVAESGVTLFSITDEKQQNDNELWYMIDSSFITTLPDTWGIKQKFILLAVNHWDRDHNRVNIGGATCDSDDYYNTESHVTRFTCPSWKKILKNLCTLVFFTPAHTRKVLEDTAESSIVLFPLPSMSL